MSHKHQNLSFLSWKQAGLSMLDQTMVISLSNDIYLDIDSYQEENTVKEILFKKILTTHKNKYI